MKFLLISCIFVCFIESEAINNETEALNREDSLFLCFTKDMKVKEKIFLNNFLLLPAELKMNILGYLSPNDLFDFIKTETFKEYHHLAVEAYGSFYGDTKISIVGSYTNGLDFDYSIEDDQISFNKIDTFTTFADVFNKFIKNLKVEFDSFAAGDLSKFIDTITKNCVKTLTRFEMHSFTGELGIFDGILFSNVIELSMFNCYFPVESIDLHEIFPKVDRLAAILTEIADFSYDWIPNNFPNLTHLEVSTTNFIEHNELELLQILQNLPNINSLGVVKCTPGILRSLNELPNIVNLGIIGISWDSRDTQEIIHMKYVQRVYYKETAGFAYSFPAFVDFEHLKELQWSVKSNPVQSNVLVDLIKKHQDEIEVLEIEDIRILDKDLRKMKNLVKLERASFRFEPRDTKLMTANGLLEFVKANRNIKEVRLFEANQQLRQDLLESFNSSKVNGWLQTLDPHTEGTGNVRIIKKPQRQINWHNSFLFFRPNFMV